MPAADATGLAGRTALVTGASRGIGLAIATGLVRAGARTFITGRDSATLGDAARSLGSLAHPVAGDLSRPADIDAILATVDGECDGPPDILVLNAGLFLIAPVGTLSVDRFAAVLQVNLVAPYQMLNALVPVMRARGSGDIVTIGSIADHTAFPGNAAYSASKFGLRGLHSVLRRELRGSGVRVSLVSPGPVDTAIWDAIEPSEVPPRDRRLAPQAVADAVLFILTQPAGVDLDEIHLGRT